MTYNPDDCIDIEVHKSAYNPVYWDFRDAQQATQIIYGGSSSGKSNFLLGQRTLEDLLNGGRNFLVVRNVGATNEGSTFSEMENAINYYGLQELFKLNRSASNLKITCLNGYSVVFKGLDDVEKVKSIRPKKGVLTDVIVEEATETKRDSVMQLMLRMRGRSKFVKRLVLLFNPVDQKHWIYKDYFIGRWDERKTVYVDDDMLILKTTYRDNKFLEADEIKRLENLKDKFWADVYRDGNWGVLGDLIFTNWEAVDLSDVKNNLGTYYNGLDFGFGPDPTAFIRAGKSRGDIYITHELFAESTHNKIIAPKIIDTIADEYVYCDCSDPRSISELSELGVSTLAAKKPPGSVEHGIRWLQGFNIFVHYELQNIINELTIYQFKKDKYGSSIRTPVDKDNHGIDALRYAFESEMVSSSLMLKHERH